jgi:hypothetical protein
MNIRLTSLVKITDIRTSSIGVDLMDGNSHYRASLNLSDLSSSNSILGVLSNVDVTGQFGSSTFVDNIGIDLSVSNDRGILLAGTDTSAVSGDVWIDCYNVSISKLYHLIN